MSIVSDLVNNLQEREMAHQKRNLAILLFDEVEVLDFAGPFEVFSVTNELNSSNLFNIRTVAESVTTIQARNGLQVVPDCDLTTCPEPDILVIPGGFGTRALLTNTRVLEWLQHAEKNCEKVLSVCSGALVLAQLGLLQGLQATTHHLVLDELKTMAADSKIVNDKRFVDNGRIITSAGVAAGIDMCLYMVGLLFGEDQAAMTAKYIEYEYR